MTLTGGCRPNASFLHIANGSCTTDLIEASGMAGDVSIWADPLYGGPVPGGLTDAELIEVRTRYLASQEAQADVDPANSLRRWRAVIERHAPYDELVLWFEHDLFDQLNLVQLLAWIRARLPATKPVSLVCIGSFPGHPRFKGLGELRPEELASLFEARERVGEPQYSLAERAWQAFRAPTPEPLDDLLHGDTAALPYLSAAFTRFLQEYPWTIDGLSRTERRLLQLADRPGVDLRAAFPRMHEGEESYYMTDSSLASLAAELSRTSPPLLTFAPGPLPCDGGLHGSVALTDTGRRVLAGRQDRVAMCGIDRWLGGVHLQSRKNMWRWDDERKRVGRT